MKSLSKYLTDPLKQTTHYLRGREMQTVYLISLLATLGSLSVSEIYGWTPFTLSILQRIFMYPILIISGLSIIFQNKKLYLSTVLLAVPGSITSTIHFITLRTNTLIGCGYALPCTTTSRIVLFDRALRPSHLPLMALTAFTAIILVILTNQGNRELLIKNLHERCKVLWK